MESEFPVELDLMEEEQLLISSRKRKKSLSSDGSRLEEEQLIGRLLNYGGRKRKIEHSDEAELTPESPSADYSVPELNDVASYFENVFVCNGAHHRELKTVRDCAVQLLELAHEEMDRYTEIVMTMVSESYAELRSARDKSMRLLEAVFTAMDRNSEVEKEENETLLQLVEQSEGMKEELESYEGAMLRAKLKKKALAMDNGYETNPQYEQHAKVLNKDALKIEGLERRLKAAEDAARELAAKLKLEEEAKVKEQAIRKELMERHQRQQDAVLKELELEKEKSMCQICFSHPRDAVLLSCMHFLYCSGCLHAHRKRSDQCPTCRGKITGVLYFNPNP